MSRPATYDHVQRGRFHILLHALALLVIVVVWQVGPGFVPLAAGLATGAVFELLALCFQQLRVADQRDHLLIAFGPLPLFRRRVRYAEMVSASVSRSSFLEGWGIHWVPFKGWIWNLQGRDCVRIQLSDTRQLTVGTDDPSGLGAFLQARIIA